MCSLFAGLTQTKAALDAKAPRAPEMRYKANGESRVQMPLARFEVKRVTERNRIWEIFLNGM